MTTPRFIGFSRVPDSNKINPFLEHLRTVCDLVHLLSAFDDYADNAPHKVVRQYADIVTDAVRNPIKSRPGDEVVLGVIAQEYSHTDVSYRLSRQTLPPVDSIGSHTSVHPQPELWKSHSRVVVRLDKLSRKTQVARQFIGIWQRNGGLKRLFEFNRGTFAGEPEATYRDLVVLLTMEATQIRALRSGFEETRNDPRVMRYGFQSKQRDNRLRTVYFDGSKAIVVEDDNIAA
ncbi:hypothetical protein ARMGADRAFT_1029519 [Armillaria gallica]|uniref:Uncharacterized protein n=1 Tax=Armillaria gallica TaxID=47427 RepID=A0A2H3E400_ARMGA|nr:hypothetical protein ARMGADRAFT_1029519 [Armillaria gallica]